MKKKGQLQSLFLILADIQVSKVNQLHVIGVHLCPIIHDFQAVIYAYGSLILPIEILILSGLEYFPTGSRSPW